MLIAGGQEKRKDRQTLKSRSEEKVAGFISAFLFRARRREAVTRVIHYPILRITQGAGIVRGWEAKPD